MEEILHLINEMSPYLLLGFFLAGILHAFVPGRCYTRYLSEPSFRSVVYAALFGIPLPLCSCGVIPTAMSLRKDGASHGAVTSFLIATPQTGVDSIIATFSLMGLPFAVIRPMAALATAVFGGMLVNRFGGGDVSQLPEEREEAGCGCCHDDAEEHLTFVQRMIKALRYAFVEMMEDIGKWLVVGLVVAGLITVFVPDSLFAVFQGNTVASMLLVLCLSIPMYLCATGSIPIAVALMLKGLTPGAGLVLLMAGPACNMASILVIRKVMGTRTLVTYLTSIIAGAVAFGWIVDTLQFGGVIDFTQTLRVDGGCCDETTSWVSWLSTAVLALLLVYALVLPKLGLRKAHACHCHEGDDACHCHDDECGCHDGQCHCHEEETDRSGNERVYIIEGMNCNHCRSAAQAALAGVEGVREVSVTLSPPEARVIGDADECCLQEAVAALGFKLRRK